MESRETVEASKDQPNTTRSRPIWMVLLLPVLVAAGLLAWWCRSTVPDGAEFAAEAAILPNGSARLERTLVVPTLDTPCPRGKNVIWCSSFQLTWNEIRDKVVGAPLKVREAEEIAGRLNAARQSISDIDPNSVYVAAGRVKEGIIEKIRKDMAAKFPSHELPDFSNYPADILAYSYLLAHVPFEHPFEQIGSGVMFTDSSENETRVGGFGLGEGHSPEHQKIREQVEVVYTTSKRRERSLEPAEYALDLCRQSQPYQIVVASVELKYTLAETLEHIRAQASDFKKRPYYEQARSFTGTTLRVPEMSWLIGHRFKELSGKIVTDIGEPILEAFQMIEFRLDRAGATVRSESYMATISIPIHFSLDHPFLLYMQKRGAEHPFFVMWVDNAELLVRR